LTYATRLSINTESALYGIEGALLDIIMNGEEELISILRFELNSKEEKIVLPDFIKVMQDITG